MREFLAGDPGHAHKKHPSLRHDARASADQGSDLSKPQAETSAGAIESVSQQLKEQIPIPQGFCCWTHCGGPFTSTKRLFPSFVTLKARPGMKVLAILCAHDGLAAPQAKRFVVLAISQ